MIKMTWLELAHPHFQQAMGAIWDCPMLDAKTSYSAHRIKQGIESTNKEIRALRIELVSKYAKKDEHGKNVVDANNIIQIQEPVAENNQKFQDEFQKVFEARSLTLKVGKLDFEKMINVRGITPNMWEFLVPICDNLPKDDFEDVPPEEVPQEVAKESEEAKA